MMDVKPIEVTLCRQEYANDCIPSCIKSIIDTLFPKNNIEKKHIMKMLRYRKNSGVVISELKNLNRSLLAKNVPLEFYVPDRFESPHIKWKDLIKPVQGGVPTICIVDWETLNDRARGGMSPHAILLAGILGGSIKYFDPLILQDNDSAIKGVTYHKFMSAWANGDKGVIFAKYSPQAKL